MYLIERIFTVHLNINIYIFIAHRTKLMFIGLMLSMFWVLKYYVNHPDVVQVPANLFDVDIPLKCHPGSSEEPPLRLRVLEGHSNKSRISLTHL